MINTVEIRYPCLQMEPFNSRENFDNFLPKMGQNNSIIQRLVQTLKGKFFKPEQRSHYQTWPEYEFRWPFHKFRDYTRHSSSKNSKSITKRQLPSSQISLSNLPPELVLEIASKLSMSFAVAWSLSSKYFYYVLARIYIPEINRNAPSSDILRYQARILPRPFLNANSRERQKLLSLLDRDDTNLVFCYFCQILHEPLTIPAHMYQTLSQYPCSHAIYGTQSCNIIFNISQVRMAMKLHHQGINPSIHLRALTQSTRSPGCYMSTTKILPRIVMNKLFMRVIHTYVIPFDLVNITWYDGAPIPTSKLPTWAVSCQLSRCPESGIVLETLKIVRRAQDKYIKMLQTKIKQCPQCKIDYQLRVPKLTIHHAIVECVSWHDLGEGDLPFWSPQMMSQMKRMTDMTIPPRVGSVKCAFENSEVSFRKLKRDTEKKF